jgi:ribonuclease HI
VVIRSKIELFSDGACKGNPGLGGWGVLINNSNNFIELKGTQQQTTNNRMELIAVIEGLKSIKENAHVGITTDSMYVKNGINQWINNWKKNGWKTAAKKPVKNKDLWQELDELVQNYSIKWIWVKGHSGHPGNERADQLANEAIEEFYDKNNTLSL